MTVSQILHNKYTKTKICGTVQAADSQKSTIKNYQKNMTPMTIIYRQKYQTIITSGSALSRTKSGKCKTLRENHKEKNQNNNSNHRITNKIIPTITITTSQNSNKIYIIVYKITRTSKDTYYTGKTTKIQKNSIIIIVSVYGKKISFKKL